MLKKILATLNPKNTFKNNIRTFTSQNQDYDSKYFNPLIISALNNINQRYSALEESMLKQDYYYEASKYLQNENFKGAIVNFNNSLRDLFDSDLENIEVLNLVNRKLIHCYYKTNDVEGIQKVLEESFLISISNPKRNIPEIFFNLYNYSVLLLKMSPQKLITFLNSLDSMIDMKILPLDCRLEIELLKGTAYGQQENFEEAIQIYETILTHQDKDFDLSDIKGKTCNNLAITKIKHLQEYLKNFEENEKKVNVAETINECIKMFRTSIAYHEKFIDNDEESSEIEDFLEHSPNTIQDAEESQKKITKEQFFTQTEMFFNETLTKEFYTKPPTDIALKNPLSLWPLCNMIETISFTEKSASDKLSEIKFWGAVIITLNASFGDLSKNVRAMTQMVSYLTLIENKSNDDKIMLENYILSCQSTVESNKIEPCIKYFVLQAYIGLLNTQDRFYESHEILQQKNILENERNNIIKEMLYVPSVYLN